MDVYATGLTVGRVRERLSPTTTLATLVASIPQMQEFGYLPLALPLCE